MKTMTRKSGIDIIGDIPWGAHFCLFYETAEEPAEIAAPYFKAGLEAGEYCLWVALEPTDMAAAEKSLRERLVSLDSYLRSGQLEIVTRDEWFYEKGTFDSQRAAEKYRNMLDRALAAGYEGVRTCFDMSWPDKSAFVDPEQWNDNHLGERLTLCMYRVDCCGFADIIDIAAKHHFCLIKRDGKWQLRNVMENNLNKRLKELRCLCDVASVTQASRTTLRETIDEVVALLPGGFRHPESIWVRVRFNGEEFVRGDYHDSRCKISSNIIVRGEVTGIVEVGYPDGTPAADAGFLKEEQLLLDAIAERLGAIVASRQAEEALRLSEEKFSKSFHASPNIVTISTLEDGRFIDVNQSYTRWTGYAREEVIGRRSLDFGIWKSEEDRKRMLERLRTQGKVDNVEISWRAKSGEMHIGRLSASIIEIGGQPCIFAVTNDITRQKESQELLQTVFQNSPFGIFMVRNGVLTHTNPQFQKITGYSQSELHGRELLSLVAAEDTDVVTSSILFTLQEKNPYPCEYRMLSKTGQIKWVMQTVSQVHWRGNVILGNIMDISELKYLERKVVEYEELSKMKGDLLATVSHELRTPLATIKGYATMILEYYSRLDAEEMKDYLRTIDGSTDRLSKLVDNLLDTSRLEAGLLKLQKSPINIAPLIRKLVEEAGVRNTEHTITASIDDRLPRVNIDTRRIGQVLDNLIDNAIKYSPPKTEITVSAQKRGPELLISVADQGPGIPREELENIFERMYQIEKRLDSDAGGIGLGLYICQRLVEAHGGMIWAESTLGRGTTIKFTLPPAAKVRRTRVAASGR